MAEVYINGISKNGNYFREITDLKEVIKKELNRNGIYSDFEIKDKIIEFKQTKHWQKLKDIEKI